MELVQIYLKHLNKHAIITNFLAFFQFLFESFSLLDPDPGGKMNADTDPQCWPLGVRIFKNKMHYLAGV